MRSWLGQGSIIGEPLGEILSYAFFFLAGVALSLRVLPAIPAALSAVWWGAVLIVVRSDLASLTIPDEASLAIATLGGLQAYLHADIVESTWTHVVYSLLNGLLAFSFFWLIKVGYRHLRGHEGLGFGDVKLAGACAIWISTSDQIIALEIAAASAAVLALLKGARGKQALIPFGAFLAPAAWLVFVAHSWFETI